MVRTIQVSDWTVVVESEEPRVSAFEIARRAGSASVREVKRLVARNRAELESHGPLPMRVTITRIEKSGAIRGEELREVETPMLNEAQAINLVALMRTKQASALRVSLVQLFVAVRRGEVCAPKLDATVINSARVRDDPSAIDRLQRAARAARMETGHSLQRIYGYVRRTMKVPSPFDLSTHLLDHVLRSLDDLARGAMFLPARLPPARSERQLDLWSH